MKFEFKAAIYPSGYIFDETYEVFRPKKIEPFYEKTIDFNSFINDIYQRFKDQYRDESQRPLFSRHGNNYLIAQQKVTVSSSGPISVEKKFYKEGIKKIETLLTDYGLNNSAQVLYEHRKEKVLEEQKKSRFEIIQDYYEAMDEAKQIEGLADHGDFLDEWEIIINKVMDRYNSDSERVIEIEKVKLLIVNDEITLFPLDLISALDCFTFKKGLGFCAYCESPFVKKRSNQIFCSNSCKSSSSRKKRLSES